MFNEKASFFLSIDDVRKKREQILAVPSKLEKTTKTPPTTPNKTTIIHQQLAF